MIYVCIFTYSYIYILIYIYTYTQPLILAESKMIHEAENSSGNFGDDVIFIQIWDQGSHGLIVPFKRLKGVPQNGWSLRDKPTKMDDLRVPL